MAQATFSIRMDETLKQKFDALCVEFGMNATTAFNIFARAVVRERRIPFEISAPSEQQDSLKDGYNAFRALRQSTEENGIQDLSMEEINEEIRMSRDTLS